MCYPYNARNLTDVPVTKNHTPRRPEGYSKEDQSFACTAGLTEALASLLTTTSPVFSPYPKKMTWTVRSSL
jgi:hypothetical protein